MQVKHWGARLALGLFLFVGVLACRTTDTFLAQATPIPTRTVRPTFTPLPPPTATPVPVPPTATATLKPTVRPTLRPTPRPPTAVPPPPPVVQPTTPPYRYKSANKGCEHSGQTFIQGTVYSGSNPIDGVRVVMSGVPDGGAADQQDSGTANPGMYSMIVEAGGAAPGQSRWVWVVENGKRASDIVQFDFNNKSDADPTSCWRAFVDFVQLY